MSSAELHPRIASRAPLALALAALLTVAAGCSGTGAGGSGDTPAEPNADELGDGEPLEDLLGPAKWFDAANEFSVECDSPGPDRTTVTGLTVVAVDRFDEKGDGSRTGNVYAVQTPGRKGLQPYNGISMRRPSYSPPDLRIFAGDVIDATGNFVEFLGPAAGVFGQCKTLPQIEGTVTYRFEGDAIDPYLLVPAALEDPAADRWAPLKSYQGARPYIGMLVRIEGVAIGELTDNAGDITAPINVGGGIAPSDNPKISNELYDIAGTGPALPGGATFEYVVGVLTYFYGFKIAPRSPADFGPRTN